MKTLTKLDMMDHLNQRLGISKKDAGKMIEDYFELISMSLEGGNPVKISGFGRFDFMDKKARPGRNPKTGEKVLITARRVAVFRPGKKLRESVLNYEDKSGSNRGIV